MEEELYAASPEHVANTAGGSPEAGVHGEVPAGRHQGEDSVQEDHGGGVDHLELLQHTFQQARKAGMLKIVLHMNNVRQMSK